jgi:D-arabinose 5-phosphate isomerase GutQ
MKMIPGMICLLALAATAGATFAAEPEHMDHPAVTKEMRAKMAAAHEQMAACLKSDRPIMECHEQMMKLHEEHMMHHGGGEHEDMDTDDCMHHMHHDHEHDHAAPSPPPPADAKPQ